MGLYDKNGDLNDNHWVLKAARWAGIIFLFFIIVGVILLDITNM